MATCPVSSPAGQFPYYPPHLNWHYYPSDYYYKKLQNLPTDEQNVFVTFLYPDSRYKEIIMLRELNIQSLIRQKTFEYSKVLVRAALH